MKQKPVKEQFEKIIGTGIRAFTDADNKRVEAMANECQKVSNQQAIEFAKWIGFHGYVLSSDSKEKGPFFMNYIAQDKKEVSGLELLQRFKKEHYGE